ncbi:response regulator transcription factor [Streptomyces sp. UNOC14_S4]|uniref:response regulator transcription factor n=1 Tax=Streptomyces sp. UNOC14_S4 TaxID=2872340 RepID=UPI001E56F99E|nr:response regulator transcription factor [Streptomyces sp. UNOC14_S4]
MNRPSVRLVIADDHTLLRQALADLLGMEGDFTVVATAGDGPSTVEAVRTHQPTVLLLDVEMPRSEPGDIIRKVAAAAPDTRVIILTMHADTELMQHLSRLGISGYLHKGVDRQALAGAIRAAAADDQTVHVALPREAPPASVSAVPDAGPARLTGREVQVLRLVSRAMSNRQIARELALSEGTVKRHLRNVFSKLGAVSRIDAVNKAVDASVLSPPNR